MIDGVVREPAGGAHRAPQVAMDEVKRTIVSELAALAQVPRDELVRRRRARFRAMGAEPGRFPAVRASADESP